jgi:hypothetical protein
MDEYSRLQDEIAKEQATIVYLQDWLTLVLHLTQSLLLKYGISYPWLRRMETQLVSALHLTVAQSQLLSSLALQDTRLMREERSSCSLPFVTSWTQLTIDDPLCEGVPTVTHPYIQYAPPRTRSW